MDSISDIFSRTKNTEINYIEYSIFFPPKDSKEASIQALYNSKRQIESSIELFVSGHLWQKDQFKLRIVHNDRKDPSFPFLFGLSRFGDCINDEWFIIYLLYQISDLYKDAIIAVSDNDGELLLIEAALALPEWLDPSNSDNRVYIYRGKLHIIPLPKSPADIFTFMTSSGTTASKNSLSRQESIGIIRQQQASGMSTAANDDIQRIIEDRLQKYNQHQQDQHEIHHARTIISNPKAAYVLLSAPQLLPLAVEAFYLRDPTSLKACATMRHFPPSSTISKKRQPSTDDSSCESKDIDTVLSWTRTTFAQALYQQFYAPKSFHLPAKHHASYQAAELGMKLMCGLEMLYTKDFSENNNVNDGNTVTGTDQVDDYDLMEMAPTAIDSMTPRQRIDELLAHYSISALEQLLKASDAENTENDMNWLDVYPDELEAMLAQKMDVIDNDSDMNSANNETANVFSGDIPVDLEEMVAKFEHFLEHSSSNVDGVKIESEDEIDEDESSEDDQVSERDERHVDEDMLKQISFDFTSFMDILKQDSGRPTSNDLDNDTVFQDVMNEMDQEITGHEKIGGSFIKKQTPKPIADEGPTRKSDENEDAPVDVQLNLIQNILESFKGQQGLPGPSGNLLRQFKIALPVDYNGTDDDDDDDVTT